MDSNKLNMTQMMRMTTAMMMIVLKSCKSSMKKIICRNSKDTKGIVN